MSKLTPQQRGLLRARAATDPDPDVRATAADLLAADDAVPDAHARGAERAATHVTGAVTFEPPAGGPDNVRTR
jgi:hypothetical protein